MWISFRSKPVAVPLLMVLGTVLGSIAEKLELHAVPAKEVNRDRPLALHCSFRKDEDVTANSTGRWSFLWSYSPPSGTGIQRIFTSSASGVTITTNVSVLKSTLTIHHVDERNVGFYTCHIICGQKHLGSKLQIKFRGGETNDPLTTSKDHLQKPKTSRKTSVEKYGGLIALGALIGLLLVTGICAIKVSGQRCCCCEIRTVDVDAYSSATTSRTYYDDPPAYESMFSHTSNFISGMMSGFSGMFTGISTVWPSNRGTVPKCSRCGKRRSVTQIQTSGHRTDSSVNSNETSPYYIEVCCDNVPSPVEKPPEYWSWMREQKTTDVFTFQTPPPLYDDVAGASGISMTSGVDVTSTIVKSNSVSEKDKQTVRPSVHRSLSDSETASL